MLLPTHCRPPKRASTLGRERRHVPSPQVTEHASHSFHCCQAQLTGQGLVLHDSVPLASPSQAAPPFCASVRLKRLRRRLPPAQETEHSPQLPQSLHSQAMGQASMLQGRWSCVPPGHWRPPLALGTMTLRQRDEVPLPQVFVQPIQGPQSLNWQSTGQGRGLQVTSSLVLPVHGEPPNAAGDLMPRVRWVLPDPQVTVQLVQLPQDSQTQLSGHFAVLQSTDWVKLRPQGLPPYALKVEIQRLRTLRPPPHVLLHGRHLPQLAHWQSTGQPFVLQVAVCLSVPAQIAPPATAGLRILRLRSVLPTPQVLVHVDQLSQSCHRQSSGHAWMLQM